MYHQNYTYSLIAIFKLYLFFPEFDNFPKKSLATLLMLLILIKESRERRVDVNIVMADRLTQLQEAVNHQADNLCNSIGIIQQVW